MILDWIEAHNFRNLTGRIFWDRGFNIIHGINGQGKTNWLEAIYTLARARSFRTQRLQETIRFGESQSLLKGSVTQGLTVQRELQISLQSQTKTISINGKREPLARYASQAHVVAFTADELEVVRGLPDARRRFVDRGVASLHPPYLQTIVNYGRIIKQKNRILRDNLDQGRSSYDIEPLIAPWNEQLVRLASEIHRARCKYVEEVNHVLDRRVFGREEISLRYISALDGKGDLANYEELISNRLRLRLPAETAAGYSLIGPHRDELEVLFDGRELRVYGSAGQQRSALLLLDLAAISLYNSCHDDYPLFLIDDVDAELDERRINSLLEYLEGRTQTFITTSKRSHVQRFLQKGKVFEIHQGSALPAEDSQVSSAAAADCA